PDAGVPGSEATPGAGGAERGRTGKRRGGCHGRRRARGVASLPSFRPLVLNGWPGEPDSAELFIPVLISLPCSDRHDEHRQWRGEFRKRFHPRDGDVFPRGVHCRTCEKSVLVKG